MKLSYFVLFLLLSESGPAQDYQTIPNYILTNKFAFSNKPLTRRAIQFESSMYAHMTNLAAVAKSYGISLPPDPQPSTLEEMKHNQYLSGSMSTRDMSIYEQDRIAKYNRLAAPVLAAEEAAQKAWRQKHPLEARLQDTEQRAANAEQQAQEAQDTAARAQQDAWDAQEKADRALSRPNNGQDGSTIDFHWPQSDE